MLNGLYDAHNHLADPAFDPFRNEISTELETIHLRKAVVNGTCPEDWKHVLDLADNDAHILPAIGLHPWKVHTAPVDWQTHFETALERGVRIVGEIGLDQWIEDYDLDRQIEAFQWQLSFAAKRNLPVSIHCLRAFEPLMPILRSASLPERGFHLHAFNGSLEILREIISLGGYVSFNGGQLKPNARAVYANIQAVPSERLLIETDAPDMLPPKASKPAILSSSEKGKALNHPKNLLAAYQDIAAIREIPLEELIESVAKNFNRYFIQ